MYIRVGPIKDGAKKTGDLDNRGDMVIQIL